MKLMVARYGMKDEERASVAVSENLVECVEQFPYRGSLYHPVGEFMLKLNVRLPMLAGPLVHCAKQSSRCLNITTKRRGYEACMLTTPVWV